MFYVGWKFKFLLISKSCLFLSESKPSHLFISRDCATSVIQQKNLKQSVSGGFLKAHFRRIFQFWQSGPLHHHFNINCFSHLSERNHLLKCQSEVYENKVITWASNFIEANFFWKATSDHAAFGIHQICQIQFEHSKNPKTEGRQWCIKQLKQGGEHGRNGNWSRKSGTETIREGKTQSY